MASAVAAGTKVTLAAVFAVLALAAAQARASELNFYSEEDCSGNFLRSCFDLSCCEVPADAASYEFHYVPGFNAFMFGSDDCSGDPNGEIDTEVRCSNDVGFESAYISDGRFIRLKNVATE